MHAQKRRVPCAVCLTSDAAAFYANATSIRGRPEGVSSDANQSRMRHRECACVRACPCLPYGLRESITRAPRRRRPSQGRDRRAGFGREAAHSNSPASSSPPPHGVAPSKHERSRRARGHAAATGERERRAGGCRRSSRLRPLLTARPLTSLLLRGVCYQRCTVGCRHRLEQLPRGKEPWDRRHCEAHAVEGGYGGKFHRGLWRRDPIASGGKSGGNRWTRRGGGGARLAAHGRVEP